MTLTQVFSCEFCEIFKNTCFYRTPLVAAFEFLIIYNFQVSSVQVKAIVIDSQDYKLYHNHNYLFVLFNKFEKHVVFMVQ